MDLRDWRVYVPTIMMGYIVIRILAVALHEIVGHGLFSILLGGSFYAVFVSPSSGFSYIFLPFNSELWVSMTAQLSGIIIELLLGGLLFFVYRRLREPFSKLIALICFQVLLFQALLYMAFGAISETGGDTFAVVESLNSQPLQVGFLITGVVWAVVIAYYLSVELIKLLAPAFSAKKWIFILLFFWLFPMFVSVALEGVRYFPPWPYIVVALVIGAIGGFFIGRIYSRRVEEFKLVKITRLPVKVKDTATLSVSFLVLTATWLGAFGVNPASAHGVFLQEPPIESEIQWFSTLVINLNVYLMRTLNASDPLDISVEFKFRGIPDLQSSLQQRIWNSFDERAYFPMYEFEALNLANDAFNTSGWNISSEGIGGSAWSQGETYDYARNIFLTLNYSGRQEILNTSSGNVTLVIRDPFRYPPPGIQNSYIDELVLGWDAGISLGNYSQTGGTTQAEDLLDMLRWRNMSAEESPHTFQVTLTLT